jgi:hypothetical protein
MDTYEHRKSKPLHQFRHGWSHYTQHRQGERHAHRRRRHRHRLEIQRTPQDTLRHARRYLRSGKPIELARQVAIGIVLALGIAFLVFAVWGVVTVLQAKNDLRGAQGEATSLARDRNQLFTAAGRQHASQQIAAMQRGAAAAQSLVDSSIPLKALGWIPFVGQQVDGVKSLVNDFSTTSDQAGTLLGSLQELLHESHGTSVSLPALDVLNLKVHQAVVALRPLNRGSGLLIGPLASSRDAFDKEIVKVTGLLAAGGHLLDYAGPFLGANGPRTYFVAGENNAEMRDQGAVLSWAILTADDGTFAMTKSHSVGTLRIRHPAPIHLPPGTESAFGSLNPTQVWQSVDATADFPLSSQTMAAMYQQRTHHRVDGVIGVDPVTLMHVLEATGPVHIPGVPENLPVTSKNVEYVLMHGLYLLYPKAYEQGRRHDEVAAVASAAVKKMKRHHYDLAYLVDQLAKATTGRHLLVWSKYPHLETAVTGFGASGSLVAFGPSEVHLAVESAVAAKLDWYVHTSAHYAVSVDQNGTATILATVKVQNGAPKGCRPHYVCGPDHINSSVRGEYVGRIDLWFPHGAIFGGALHESGLQLSRWTVRLLPGKSETVLLEALVPHAVQHGRYRLTFVPQSSLTPQRSSLSFSAPGWNVGGPASATWPGTADATYTWQLSR